MKINKKGNVNSLYPIVLTLVLIGMLLGAGIIIMEKFTTSMYAPTNTLVINSTATGAITEVPTAFPAAYREASCGSFRCYNETGTNKIIPAANYTITQPCSVAYSGPEETTTGYNTSIWKCTYTINWKADSIASNATRDTTTALSTLPATWIPILVVVILAGMIIMYLTGAFGGKKK